MPLALLPAASSFAVPLPLADLASMLDQAAGAIAWLASLACGLFGIAVGVFHVRSRGEHAFPRATIALLAFCVLTAIGFAADATGSPRLASAARFGVFGSGAALFSLMFFEMRSAVRFPSVRATMERLHSETAARQEAQAEVDLRAQLFTANGNVAIAIGTAASVDELAQYCAGVLVSDIGVASVRVWTLSRDGRHFTASGAEGIASDPASLGETIPAMAFREAVAARRPMPFSRSALSDDSHVLDRSRFIEHGLLEFAAFPLEVDGELVGLLELLHHDRFAEIQLSTFAPIAAAMAQGIRRQLTQSQLRDSLDRFETLTELAPVAIFVSRRNGELTYSNDQWSKLSGRRAVGQASRPGSSVQLRLNWIDAIEADRQETIRREWSEAAANGKTYSFQAKLRPESGDNPPRSPRSVLGQLRPLPGQQGYLGVVSDLTPVKRAERRARSEGEKVERLTALSVTMADTLSKTTDDTFFDDLLDTLVNRFDCRFGAIGIVSEAEKSNPGTQPVFETRALIDRTAEAAPSGADLVGLRCPIVDDLARVWQTGRPGIAQGQVSSPLGGRRLNNLIAARVASGHDYVGMIFVGDSSRPLDLSDRDLLDRAAQIVGTIVTSRLHLETAQTKRRAAEQSLRTKQLELEHLARIESMGELATGLAHELNQPLAAIINFVDSMRHRLPETMDDRDRFVRLIDRIDKQAARAADIVRNLRTMIQKDTPSRHPVQLSEVVERALELVQPDARLHDIRLDYAGELLGDDEAIFANEVEVQQVVVNLVQNALDAVRSQDHKQVAVTVTGEDAAAVLRVSDSGPGVPDRPLEDLFASFFTTKPHGMGVGLRICRTIVEAHGGRIGVRVGEMGGLEFEVVIPTIGSDVAELEDTQMRIAAESL